MTGRETPARASQASARGQARGQALEDAAKALREEFVRLLTVDSETNDARRRDFNQAIFAPYGDDEIGGGGYAVWTSTSLGMVLAKFDKAVRNIQRDTQ